MGLKDEQGMIAIGVALMLIVVLALFGGVLWQYSMAEIRRVERTEQDLRALFLARGGAEAVMSAWLASEPGDRPALPITMDTIYYNTADGFFSHTTKPADYLGFIDVVIDRENVSDDEDRDIYATVIEAVATVGGTARTVRLMTYPHRYGHEFGWYEENAGKITEYGSAPGELVVMRTEPVTKEIHIGKGTPKSYNRIPFETDYLVFDSPLNLGLNASNLKDSTPGEVDVVLAADIVFLNGLTVTHLSSEVLEKSATYYGVKLELPSGDARGQVGSEIVGNIEKGNVHGGFRYGAVYFQGNQVSLDEYKWERYWEWIIIPKAKVAWLQTTDLNLENKAFYFRDGMHFDPKKIKEHLDKHGNISGYFDQLADEGWLVPIREDKQLSREELEGMQPFFWDQ